MDGLTDAWTDGHTIGPTLIIEKQHFQIVE